MNIIPAIDLYNGKVVRLKQGDFAQATHYAMDACELMQDYASQGFTRAHVVDLSGAEQGHMQQETLLQRLCAHSTIKVQVGGGIRSIEQIERLFTAGVDRVVIGSLAVDNPQTVQQWLAQFGADRLVLAIDVVVQAGIPVVMTGGWQKNTQMSLHKLLSQFAEIENVLCTDIERDGLLQGPNLKLYEQLLCDFPKVNWIASGGVADLDDLRALNAIDIRDVVVGKALYEQKLTLTQCLEAQRW